VSFKLSEWLYSKLALNLWVITLPLNMHTLTCAHSKWPTFPQVYMDGELVGGADIMLQMHQSGELIGELEKVGHRSILDKSEKADKS